MSIKDGQADLTFLLQRASEILGMTVRPLSIDGEMGSFLGREVRKVGTYGLGTEPSVRMFHSGSKGNAVICGFVEYEVRVSEDAKSDGRPVSLLRIAMGAASRALDTLIDEGHLTSRLGEMQHRADLYELVDYEQYNHFDQDVFNFQIDTTGR